MCVSLQVELSTQRLPEIHALIKNVTERLQPHRYLHDQGLYTDLSLSLMGQELSQLETDVGVIHSQLNNAQTKKLSAEVRQDTEGQVTELQPERKCCIMLSCSGFNTEMKERNITK